LKRGCKEEELPPPLQDIEVARSKKGKAGQIVVRSISGVTRSPGATLARRLEHDFSSSREDLLEKLAASGNQSQTLGRLLQVLEENPEIGLARAIAVSKADVGAVLDWYAKGALALKKMETVLEIYKQVPHLMRDLAKHAIDSEVDCEVCFGVGKVTARSKGVQLLNPCPKCKGSGKRLEVSAHKEFAVGKLLEMSEMLPKRGGPMVNVNQAVQVNAAGAGSEVLAKLSKAADEILYGASTKASSFSSSDYTLDAELVEANTNE
jgi:hypothetical protein